MIRYKVITYGGIRGLEFPDLLIKYSSGYAVPLEVHQGEYLPLEILDSSDIKKSLIAGSLGRFIAQGKVAVEGDELPKIELKRKREPRVNSPESPATQKSEPTQDQQKKDSNEFLSAPINPKVEPPKVIEPQITNLSDVKELKDFDRLSFYLKKRFLRETQDKALLLHIFQTTDSNSFKLMIKQRLKDFG